MGLLGMHDEESIGTERVDASHAGGYARSSRVDLVAVAEVDDADHGAAIGTDGRNIHKARRLADRHFDIDDIELT